MDILIDFDNGRKQVDIEDAELINWVNGELSVVHGDTGRAENFPHVSGFEVTNYDH